MHPTVCSSARSNRPQLTSNVQITMSTPRFFQQPLKYLHWAAIEKPAIFYSIIIGSCGPLAVFTVPSIRHALGDGPRPPVPFTYPSMYTPRSESRESWKHTGSREIGWAEEAHTKDCGESGGSRGGSTLFGTIANAPSSPRRPKKDPPNHLR